MTRTYHALYELRVKFLDPGFRATGPGADLSARVFPCLDGAFQLFDPSLLHVRDFLQRKHARVEVSPVGLG
jgi:hypothetical protein